MTSNPGAQPPQGAGAGVVDTALLSKKIAGLAPGDLVFRR